MLPLIKLLPGIKLRTDVTIHYPFGRPKDGEDVLWRCDARSYSYIIDAEREEYGSTSPRLEMTFWRVMKRTPKGARLEGGRFVNLTATKQWACRTQAEALESFIRRRKKQIAIYQGRLQRAEYELALAEHARLV